MKKIILLSCVLVALASTFFVSCASNKAEETFVEVPAESGDK